MIVASAHPLAPQQRFAGSPRPATVPPTHLGGAPSNLVVAPGPPSALRVTSRLAGIVFWNSARGPDIAAEPPDPPPHSPCLKHFNTVAERWRNRWGSEARYHHTSLTAFVPNDCDFGGSEGVEITRRIHRPSDAKPPRGLSVSRRRGVAPPRKRIHGLR